jgi:acyl transferase domain-containing protein/SAM-dependent methyltransferase
MPRDSVNGGTEELSPVKRALLEVRDLRSRLRAAEEAGREPVAIVGMGCRFPGGANGPEALWQLLLDGVDAIREVPADRWDHESYYDPDALAPGKIATRWGGFIDGVDQFDPQHFSISPREAMAMDPQQRLLLEVSWEALEHAGYAPDALSGSSTGVFAGISSLDYAHLALSAPEGELDSYLAQGIAHSAASGRIAYTLGLQGPAMSVDSACSSSLYALHLAVQSLRRNECRMALVGGVNVVLTPTMLIGFSRAQMMAADGRCKTFDARADGFVRAEGCGVLVVKRLRDALGDGDRVWAVVRGSAANQDGRSSGFTAPNGLAQESVIRAALRDAGVSPVEVAYVEAHGTGTSLGDPIEVQALGAVLGERLDGHPVRVGSIKSNLGHMEAAAGVAGVIKAALALHHGLIPGTLHVETPNPLIPWRELHVAIATEPANFPDGRRVAGVSSFGFSGTNVHVVLEGAPSESAPSEREVQADGRISTPTERQVHLLKLSARDPQQLDAVADRWIEFLGTTGENFGDVTLTSTIGRADLPERLLVVAGSNNEARARLEGYRNGIHSPWVRRGRGGHEASEIAFLFTGHGAQYHGMGRQLFESQPVYRAAIEDCDALLRPHLAEPLLDVLYGAGTEAEASPLLAGMTYAQPALFAVEYAIARVWESWGIHPTAVLGHSLGEYAAAAIAGVFSLADGLRLVATRGRLMDSLPEAGGMLAVFAPEAVLREILAVHPALSIAAINAPEELVVSGEAGAIAALAAELPRHGIEGKRLMVAQAAHSPMLDAILDEFERAAAEIRYHAPQLALISCTTGAAVSGEEIGNARYWRRHLRETVQFARAMNTLHDEGYRVFVEVGPHPALSCAARQCVPDDGVLWGASLRRNGNDWEQLLESVATLCTGGVAIDWSGVERALPSVGERQRRRVPAPTHVWKHDRYWLAHAHHGFSPARADATPRWDQLLSTGRRVESQGPLDLAVQTFPSRWEVLERLTTAVVASTLREVGVFGASGGSSSIKELHARHGILPRYSRLIVRWLARMTAAGLLEQSGERFTATQACERVDVDAAWRDADRVLADWPFMLGYLRRCASLLRGVITGTESPLETMFPGGSFDCADALYRDSVLPRYFNQLATGIVEPLARAGGRPLRVLEVGGGTGGLTASLLPLVTDAGGSYHFTDVSELFLSRAAERFAGHQRVSFGLLDIDRDLQEQGCRAGSFDVIAASNVIHASSDVPGTLEQLRSLLAPGGILVMIEVTTYLAWFEFSTALLEGWDRQDDGIRREHPMLSAEEWQAALRAAGFAEAAAFPRAGTDADALAQHVMVAQAARGEVAPASDETFSADGTIAARAERSVVEPGAEFAARIAGAAPHEREDLLVEFVRSHIASLLRMESPAVVSRRGRLMDLGLDSLMAVELRSRLSKGLALEQPLPATLIFDYPTPEAIVGLLLRLLGGDGVASPVLLHMEGARRQRAAAPVPSGDLTVLSDDEVEARLLARLKLIEEEA